MGQYFIIVNKQLDEYINPHEFGDGAKLLEFGSSGAGTMTALALLLRQSSEGGGGDYYGDDTEYVGRWAGCKIVIVGDYDESELYDIAQKEKEYTNVSKGIRDIMVDDLGYKYKIHEEGGFVSRGE